MPAIPVAPKTRGFICITAHPAGCEAHVQEQIQYICSQNPLKIKPKNVLIIGASTGYGLASRITATFAGEARTLGVFFERPATEDRPASAGWYNTAAFEKAAHKAGYYAKSINGDAFSNLVKEKTIEKIKADLGKIDLIIYSLASPRRTDPITGTTYTSTLKPIEHTFENKTVNTDKGTIQPITLEPATKEEIFNTEKVMGGEDWALWIEALMAADVLSAHAHTIAYSYIGPEVTWPIYYQGTIGRAKAHLEKTALELQKKLAPIQGQAHVAINKAVVTQASSAIPVVPLYNSILFKIMKEKGLHEDCIEQMYRLFNEHLYSGKPLTLDVENRIRIDDWEMRSDIQEAVKAIWPQINTENLHVLSDFKGYQENFLKLFGFGLPKIDIATPVEIQVPIEDLTSCVM